MAVDGKKAFFGRIGFLVALLRVATRSNCHTTVLAFRYPVLFIHPEFQFLYFPFRNFSSFNFSLLTIHVFYLNKPKPNFHL